MTPFTVKPKHWWTYLNPFWYQRKRFMQQLIKYQWEQGGKEAFEKKLRDHFLYGKPL